MFTFFCGDETVGKEAIILTIALENVACSFSTVSSEFYFTPFHFFQVRNRSSANLRVAIDVLQIQVIERSTAMSTHRINPTTARFEDATSHTLIRQVCEST